MDCSGLLNEIGYKTLIMSHQSNSSTSLLYGETNQQQAQIHPALFHLEKLQQSVGKEQFYITTQHTFVQSINLSSCCTIDTCARVHLATIHP